MSDLREAVKAAIQDAWDEKSHDLWGTFKDDAAGRILALLREHGLVELDEDQSLPEIPEFQYDKPEDRPLLQRGAINYSKLLSGFRRIKEIA